MARKIAGASCGSTSITCPVMGLIRRYGGSSRTLFCVCVWVVIGSSGGMRKDSACAVNAATSGEYMLICSGSAPSSVGSSRASVLVSDGAGVLALRGERVGGVGALSSWIVRLADAKIVAIRVASWSSSPSKGPCSSIDRLSCTLMLQRRSSPAGRCAIQNASSSLLTHLNSTQQHLSRLNAIGWNL